MLHTGPQPDLGLSAGSTTPSVREFWGLSLASPYFIGCSALGLDSNRALKDSPASLAKHAMKKTILFLSLITILISCQEKKYGAFTVSGKITHALIQKIFLQEIPFGGEQPIVLDSGTLKANGIFELRGLGKEEGLYRLVIENGPDVLLVNDNKHIKLQLDINHFKGYTIEGSPASESLHKLFEEYRVKDSALYVTFMQLDTLQKQNVEDNFKEYMPELNKEKINLAGSDKFLQLEIEDVTAETDKNAFELEKDKYTERKFKEGFDISVKYKIKNISNEKLTFKDEDYLDYSLYIISGTTNIEKLMKKD